MKIVILLTTKSLQVQVLVMPKRQLREVCHLSAMKSWRKEKKAEPAKHQT